MVDQVGTVRIDFQDVDLSRFRTTRTKGLYGSKLCDIQFDVQISFGSKSGLLQVDTTSEGVPTGSAELVFE